jgi:predicted transcriptional regulator
MEFVRTIEELARKTAPGRAPSFNEIQVIKALEIIYTLQPVGRKRLSEELELGEGVVRTLLRHAMNARIIELSKNGIKLSELGEELFSCIRSRNSEVMELPNSALTIGPFNVGILVRNVARHVKTGIEQRDASLMAGASGATTLVFSKNRLVMPGSGEEIFAGVPNMYELLLLKLRPKENDVIIIGSGQDEKSAEFGARMAAFELLKRSEHDGSRAT